MKSTQAPLIARTPGSFRGCWCPLCKGGPKSVPKRHSRVVDRREGKNEIQKQLKESNGY